MQLIQQHPHHVYIDERGSRRGEEVAAAAVIFNSDIRNEPQERQSGRGS